MTVSGNERHWFIFLQVITQGMETTQNMPALRKDQDPYLKVGFWLRDFLLRG